MNKTDFAGLTVLAPGEPLSTDGYAFQSTDRVILDRLLRIGARLHRHDGHDALPDPTDQLETEALTTGGTIAADAEIIATYTLVDEYGGETLPAEPVGIATTASLFPPLSSPETEVQAFAGAEGGLRPGIVYYAITFLDAAGVETTPGPAVQVDIEPEAPEVDTEGDGTLPTAFQVVISGLADLAAAEEGAAGWRLYKANGLGTMYLLAEGSVNMDSVTDDGTLCLDCTDTAPTTNDTNGTNSIVLTVPDSPSNNAEGAVAFRVYMSYGSSLANPSFIEERPLTDLGVPLNYGSILALQGTPPDVSTAIAGAEKIDPDTDLLDFPFKRPVATYNDLPEGAQGDMRVTLDDGRLWVVKPIEGAEGPAGWSQIQGTGGAVGAGHDIWDDGTPMPAEGILDFRGAAVTLTDDPDTGATVITIEGGGGGGGGAEAVAASAEGINLAIPDDFTEVTSTITVPGSGVVGEDYGYPELRLYLTHPVPNDLVVSLVAPDSTPYVVLWNTNFAGADLGTGFEEGAWVSLNPANANLLPDVVDYPVVGDFAPDGDWSTMVGTEIGGDWSLVISDQVADDAGTLVSWGLNFEAMAPGPAFGPVKLDLEDGVEWRTGSDEGALAARLYTRPSRALLEREGINPTWESDGEWHDLIIEGPNFGGLPGAFATMAFDATTHGLTLSDDSPKVISYKGTVVTPGDLLWADDVRLIVGLQIDVAHVADFGEVYIGFEDADNGNGFGLRAGPGGASQPLIVTQTLAGANEAIPGAVLADQPDLPGGITWYVVERTRGGVFASRYDGLHPDEPGAVPVATSYGVPSGFEWRPGLGLPVHPRVDFVVTEYASVIAFPDSADGTPGFKVEGYATTTEGRDLWAMVVDANGVKHPRLLISSQEQEATPTHWLGVDESWAQPGANDPTNKVRLYKEGAVAFMEGYLAPLDGWASGTVFATVPGLAFPKLKGPDGLLPPGDYSKRFAVPAYSDATDFQYLGLVIVELNREGELKLHAPDGVSWDTSVDGELVGLDLSWITNSAAPLSRLDTRTD